MGTPRVLLADDHALLLGAFEKLLAGECRDRRSGIRRAGPGGRSSERLKPDVVVLDISMPLLNGLEAGRQIKQKQREGQAGLSDDERGSGSGGRGVPFRGVRILA